MKISVALLALLVAFASAEEDLFKGNSVVTLNKAALDALDSDKAYFIKFYAPWCGHCQRLAPTWEELGEKLADKKDKVIIAKVDCTEDKDACGAHEIQGYPTLKFFSANLSKEGERYRGARELEALEAFVLEKIGEKVPEKKAASKGLFELNDSNFDKHIETGNHFIKFYAPWCGHCKNLAPTWDELAEKFVDSSDVAISKVDCTQHKEICSKFEIRGYPTLLFLRDGGKTVDKYQGSRTLEHLTSFIEDTLKTKPKPAEPAGGEAAEKEGVPLLLTEDNFEEEIGTGVTFVKFFAPWCGHCRNLAPTWTDLARKLSSAKIAKVDCTEQDALCNSNEIQGYPSLVLFKDGKRVEEYNGARDFDDLKDFVERHVQAVKDEL